MDRTEVFRELEERGVDRVVIPYSGGNDEGGPDAIDLYKEGKKVGELLAARIWGDDKIYVRDERGSLIYEPFTYTSPSGEKVESSKPKTRSATAEELRDDELCRALEQPIYDRWGSFAGEFYTSGVCVWDTKIRKAMMDEDIEEPTHRREYWID